MMSTESAQNDSQTEAVIMRSLKRTYDLFKENNQNVTSSVVDDKSQRIKIAVKIADEFAPILQPPPKRQTQAAAATPALITGASTTLALPAPPTAATDGASATTTPQQSTSESIIDEAERKIASSSQSTALIRSEATEIPTNNLTKGSIMLLKQQKETAPKPQWHAPWKCMRVISGHLGWVRCIAVDVGNEWFATGGSDRTIKIWDLASGTLKLTLTGHISAVRGLAISDRHPYLFSVGEDKVVKCWDLEQNKCIKHYHGHLSGVYCCSLHPTLDILCTGGRDATVRVWDVRTTQQIFALSGHNSSVGAVATQATEPQIVSGGMDSLVKLWDLAAGKNRVTLTNHKKSIRSVVLHPKEYTFATASSDNIKKWKCPDGNFLHNFSGHNAVINSISVNSDNVMVSAADNGSMAFWDWKTGYNFQSTETIAQPGSLDSETGVYATCFDHSGSRLITGEADKSIKIWREDENATPETHPVKWKPELERKRY